jgi:cell division protease FtsH
MALGMVQSLPEHDSVSKSLEQFESEIAILMAGKVAEEIIYGVKKVTSGASSDIKAATNYARSMVKELGLSKKIGNVYHGGQDEMHPGGGDKVHSEKTSELIDSEVKRIIDEGHDFAKHIMTKHLDQLHILAKALIEQETLSGKQIKHLLLGNPIDSESDPTFPATGKKKAAVSANTKKSQPVKAKPSKKKEDS